MTQNNQSDNSWIGALFVLGLLAVGVLLIVPNSTNNINKALNAEGRSYVGAMNRAQQAYYIEKGNFAPQFQDLQLGVNNKTKYYSYHIERKNDQVFNYAISNDYYRTKYILGLPVGQEKVTLNSYIGGVFLIKLDKKDTKLKNSTSKPSTLTTLSIICESPLGMEEKPPLPQLKHGKVYCGQNMNQISP